MEKLQFSRKIETTQRMSKDLKNTTSKTKNEWPTNTESVQ